MYSDSIIEVRGLGKKYSIYARPHHKLIELVAGGDRAKEFWALRGLDINIARGETVGIVGRNGSGKSTLLQLIAGTLNPSEGEIVVNGRVAALLELGSGFNTDFTGRENVYLNASLHGLTKREIDERFDEIVRFSEIEEFIDQPVRNYSSGMMMRLAFSVVAHVDAEILIIDEALAVGDAFFTQKCMRFMRAFQERGTLLFVSHDTAAVTGLCDRAIWLDHGRMLMQGEAKAVAEAYLEAFITEREGRLRPLPAVSIDAQKRASKRGRDFRSELFERSTLRNDLKVFEFDPNSAGGFGDGSGRIIDVTLRDRDGKDLAILYGGETVVLEILVQGYAAESCPIVGFYLKDRLGQLLFGDNTYLCDAGQSQFVLAAGECAIARFHFEMPRLQFGDYFITVGLASGTQDEHVIQHWIHEAVRIKAEGQGLRTGIIGLPMDGISIEKVCPG